MTTPAINTRSHTPDTALEWIEQNSLPIIIAAVVVVVAAGSYWFIQRSDAQRETLAASGLEAAKQTKNLGNLPLAQTDLKRLVENYAGTAPAAEGAMILAQMNFDQGNFDGGIKMLQGAVGKTPKALQSEVRDLIGDGYVGLQKPSDAAKAYEQAAAAAVLDGESANERAKAARAYLTAHDSAKAKAIWTSLIDDPKDFGIGAEARVRLGELTATPVGRK